MDDDKILELTGKIEEKLGKENFAVVSDTIGEILTGNSVNMNEIKKRDEEIRKLTERNEKLVEANGSLLQQIPMSESKKSEPEAPEKPKSISLKDAFDAKGNFIH